MQSRFDTLPRRLKKVSTEFTIGAVPCLLSCIDAIPRPFIFWMHGRTADKELDPGRYLRYIRRGINVCAVDLPGHGERFDAVLQEPQQVLQVIMSMADEIDGVLDGLASHGSFDLARSAIGGMSAGGMAAIQRLLRPHQFKVAVLEAATGDLSSMREKPICVGLNADEFDEVNPMNRVENWGDIPVISIHSRHDEWIPFAGQKTFMNALKEKSKHPETIEFISFDRTGAPYEHVGFGRESAFVKEVQVEFVAKHLQIDLENL
ncbi:MAG: prolyl oligopeptidase family serine peptidase [Phycisphaerae bacterium]|jgi:predicted peptidase|nr:prolyl oligopeptidase family serine peptidase [Phycisphaerae bacterium]